MLINSIEFFLNHRETLSDLKDLELTKATTHLLWLLFPDSLIEADHLSGVSEPARVFDGETARLLDIAFTIPGTGATVFFETETLPLDERAFSQARAGLKERYFAVIGNPSEAEALKQAYAEKLGEGNVPPVLTLWQAPAFVLQSVRENSPEIATSIASGLPEFASGFAGRQVGRTAGGAAGGAIAGPPGMIAGALATGVVGGKVGSRVYNRLKESRTPPSDETIWESQSVTLPTGTWYTTDFAVDQQLGYALLVQRGIVGVCLVRHSSSDGSPKVIKKSPAVAAPSSPHTKTRKLKTGEYSLRLCAVEDTQFQLVIERA